MLRFVPILVLLLPLSGCYYMQAVKGQLELNSKREPIDEVLQDEGTSPELAARLRLVQEAREFSVEELSLPDNKSYRTYADIEREFVIWNVVAAPEFSTQPKTSCFPVAGCVGYRGYFSRDDALRESEKLTAQGFDVEVGGVAAYSTLGKFNDPVVSSMMKWGDVRLVGVLFHELAHQVLYVKGDSGFNESFATAVEEFGVQRWLESRGQVDDIAAYRDARQLRQDLMALVAVARVELGELYTSDIDDEDKRRQKKTRLHLLGEDAAALLQRNGRDGTNWLNGELNNARLVSMTLYEGRLPEFRALFDHCKQDFECFFDESRALAGR
jgi:predicted aminopeptidase